MSVITFMQEETHTGLLIALLVLSGIDFCNDLFQLTFSFTLRKIVHIIILWSGLDQPLGFDIRHRAYVVFSGQDKFIVKDPFGLVI